MSRRDRSERRGPRQPTDGELEILDVLWARGQGTVREVHAELNARRGDATQAGHTTVLKLMQIMTEKGLLLRDETVRPQVYRPARSQEHTQEQLVSHLLEKAFRGSAGNLVLQALSSRGATPEEQRRIRQLLDRMEREPSSDEADVDDEASDGSRS